MQSLTQSVPDSMCTARCPGSSVPYLQEVPAQLSFPHLCSLLAAPPGGSLDSDSPLWATSLPAAAANRTCFAFVACVHLSPLC